MKAKITKRAVEQLKPGEMLSDTEVRGFVARRLPSGTIQYGFRYRPRNTNKRRWLTLGLHGNATPDNARKQAQKAAAEVVDNRDPLNERRNARTKAAQSKTVESILNDFTQKYVVAQGLRSEREIRRIFRKYVIPAIGDLPIESVRRSHMTEMLDKIDQSNGPVMADRVRAHLSSAFHWYEARSDHFRSPIVKGMARAKHTERARSRLLNENEIQTFWSASEKLAKPSGGLTKILLLTGQRRSEVGDMRWDEISDGLWIIPAANHKSKKPHVVPLSAEVQRILETLPRRGEYVFGRYGKTPFSGFSKLKTAIDTEIGRLWIEEHSEAIENWVLHDLRRTARSLMAACGVRPEIAERVLGHTIKGVEGVYDRYVYRTEKSDALDRLAAKILQIVENPAPKVVQLRRAEG